MFNESYRILNTPCQWGAKFNRLVLFAAAIAYLAGGVSGCLLDYHLAEDAENDSNSDADTDYRSDTATDPADGEDTEDDPDTDGETDGPRDTERETDVDTDTERETDVDTDTERETDLPSCPVGIEFRSTTEVTELIEGTSPKIYEYEDSCDRGEVIVGFQGFLRTKNNTVHGKIQALCAQLNVRFTGSGCVVETEGTHALPLRGDEGHVEWSRMCPQDQVIAGYEGRTGADIDNIVFKCAPLLVNEGKNGYTLTRGGLTALQVVGGTGGNHEYQDECPGDQVATSTVMYANNVLVDALGLGCQVPSFVR